MKNNMDDIFTISGASRALMRFFVVEGMRTVNIPTNKIREIPGGFSIGDSEFHIVVRSSEHGREPYTIVVYSNQLVIDSQGAEDDEGSIREQVYGTFRLTDYAIAARALVMAYASFVCDSYIQSAFDHFMDHMDGVPPSGNADIQYENKAA